MRAKALNADELVAQTTERFQRAELVYGHGTDCAEDDALFLVLEGLGWSYEIDQQQLAAPLSELQIAAVEQLVARRIEQRCPAAYIARRMWFAGLEFYVDERVLVPRSPLAELITDGVQPWIGDHDVRAVLDIGTGSGCIAIALAAAFPQAKLTATDLSDRALEVAAINRDRHDLAGRLQLVQADLFPPRGQRFDLIVSNPPYVPNTRVDALPAEYQAEPRSGLAAGADGMACVSRILDQAADYLHAGGLLIVEVGETADDVAERYPDLPFTWLEFSNGGEGVFLLSREQLSHEG